MRFLALLKKELRECLPWAISAAAFLLIFGSFKIWDTMQRDVEYKYRTFERYSEVRGYDLQKYPLGDVGPLLFMTAVGLGLALGVRQFWVADFMGTWGFVLHRSTSRTTILAAKIFAGLISFIVAIGLVWCYLFWRANLPDYSPVPLPKRWLIQGWLVCGMGLLAYLGAGLAGMSKTRWYTTKLTGLAFALWMFVTLTQQWALWWGIGTLVIAVVVLLYLMWVTFLKRQFT
jgi:heme/copper-type cytochrome/quinol oxidase subunit 4